MTRYLIVSKKFSGFLIYGFNKDGYLIEFRNCTWGYETKTIQNILTNLPLMLTFSRFKAFTDEYEMDVRMIETDLSFERWYREYDMARDKKQAQDIWKRLKGDMVLRAFWIKEAYERYLKKFKLSYKMYPKAFLGSHLEDEYDKIKELPKQ